MAETVSDSDIASNPPSSQSEAQNGISSSAIVTDNLEAIELNVESLGTSDVAISDSGCSKDVTESDEISGERKSLSRTKSTLQSCSDENFKSSLAVLAHVASDTRSSQSETPLVELQFILHPHDEFFSGEKIFNMAVPDKTAYETQNGLQVHSNAPEPYDVSNEPEIASSIPRGTTLTENKRNMQQIMCLKCQSTILIPEMATLVDIEYTLPGMVPSDIGPERLAQEESLKHYWCVDNMFSFENVGFSHTKDGIKYLICADCEIGPIGWHDVETKLSYVSPFRIRYV